MALMTGVHKIGFSRAMHDPDIKGRWIESAVGAHFLMDPKIEVYYWRENNKEVDFVIKMQDKLIAVEVKSGRKRENLPGMLAFEKSFFPTNTLLIGTGGIPLEMFLKTPLQQFLE